ncbi:uncharacterized protein LOC128207122 [Mya arenaria]|uniref:uncharacterized protein LOC128207122 n=1 Tax=Mya arenaria TaxID=6604 RepID=UPI0022E66BF0|nr:uncharacterized protein LOC128207122 [Mya arenaria]
MAENKTPENDKKSVFEAKGFGSDEVVFQFETEEGCEELYAPRSILVLASPVFKAMFEGNFKEKSEGVVKITDFSKKYFLEFLLWCNPGTKQPIDESNVLEVLPIAEKYDVEPLKEKCRTKMLKWLQRCDSNTSESHGCVDVILPMLKILHTVVLYSYEKVTASAINTITRRGSGFFAFEEFDLYTYTSSAFGPMKTKHKECVKLFSELPLEIQIRIYRQRLLKKDDNKLVK